MEIPALSQLLPTTGIAIPRERCYISVQVTVFSRPPDTLLPSSVISSAPVNRKKPEITFSYIVHGITEHFYIPSHQKKSLYNRWDTRIKMLNTDKDGKDTNLKVLKLVRRFIKDCGYLDRHCCPVNPFPC
jgi:hypothetical protein